MFFTKSQKILLIHIHVCKFCAYREKLEWVHGMHGRPLCQVRPNIGSLHGHSTLWMYVCLNACTFDVTMFQVFLRVLIMQCWWFKMLLLEGQDRNKIHVPKANHYQGVCHYFTIVIPELLVIKNETLRSIIDSGGSRISLTGQSLRWGCQPIYLGKFFLKTAWKWKKKLELRGGSTNDMLLHITSIIF